MKNGLWTRPYDFTCNAAKAATYGALGATAFEVAFAERQRLGQDNVTPPVGVQGPDVRYVAIFFRVTIDLERQVIRFLGRTTSGGDPY